VGANLKTGDVWSGEKLGIQWFLGGGVLEGYSGAKYLLTHNLRLPCLCTSDEDTMTIFLLRSYLRYWIRSVNRSTGVQHQQG